MHHSQCCLVLAQIATGHKDLIERRGCLKTIASNIEWLRACRSFPSCFIYFPFIELIGYLDRIALFTVCSVIFCSHFAHR